MKANEYINADYSFLISVAANCLKRKRWSDVEPHDIVTALYEHLNGQNERQLIEWRKYSITYIKTATKGIKWDDKTIPLTYLHDHCEETAIDYSIYLEKAAEGLAFHEAKLYKMYIAECKSTYDIAKEINIPARTIQHWVKELKEKLKTKAYEYYRLDNE